MKNQWLYIQQWRKKRGEREKKEKDDKKT